MLVGLLATSALLVVIYMTAWFLVARKRQRLDTVDSAWGGGFAVVAWSVALQQPSIRTFMVAVLVTIWSGRLTLHLARRSGKGVEDPRYVSMTKSWKRVWLRAYFAIFLLQGALILAVSLPIITNAGTVLPWLRWLFTLGYFVWALGFYIEYRADKELANFVSNPKNKGKLLDTGLWRYSRHPNYFGELMQWWGIGLIACQTSFGWIGLLGPLLLTILIVFVSGIPTVEKRRDGDKNYQAYKKRTSVLIPLPPKS